eukprot:2631832-Amphidinium_carterae.1
MQFKTINGSFQKTSEPPPPKNTNLLSCQKAAADDTPGSKLKAGPSNSPSPRARLANSLPNPNPPPTRPRATTERS